jgi:hypothetical protein
MLRSLRGQDFIALPSLSEAGTLTLVDDLEAAAKACAKLPSSIYASLGFLLEQCSDLKRHIAARERAGSSADPRARAADRALDDAWGAFQSWLMGWTRLPDRAHPLIADARALYAALFPKGLQFLTLDFRDEWNESQMRLDHIAEAKLDSVIDKLGGGPFLATLSRMHRAYGEALHITPSSRDGSQAEPDTDVLRALDSTHMALREYVAQVAATVKRNDMESVGMADRLLEPISSRATAADSWESVDDDATVVSVYT